MSGAGVSAREQRMLQVVGGAERISARAAAKEMWPTSKSWGRQKRAGVGAQMRAGVMLARLEKRGLVEHTAAGVWRLADAGRLVIDPRLPGI